MTTRVPPWKQNRLPPMVNIMRVASAKSPSMRGASHHPTFMGHCWTISHTFYSPIYLMDEGNEDVGSVGDVILLFFLFGVNQVH